jgi:hypothetical protein
MLDVPMNSLLYISFPPLICSIVLTLGAAEKRLPASEREKLTGLNDRLHNKVLYYVNISIIVLVVAASFMGFGSAAWRFIWSLLVVSIAGGAVLRGGEMLHININKIYCVSYTVAYVVISAGLGFLGMNLGRLSF